VAACFAGLFQFSKRGEKEKGKRREEKGDREEKKRVLQLVKREGDVEKEERERCFVLICLWRVGMSEAQRNLLPCCL